MKLECQVNPLYWNDTPHSYCPTMQPVRLIGVVLPIHQSSLATHYANRMLKHPAGLSTFHSRRLDLRGSLRIPNRRGEFPSV